MADHNVTVFKPYPLNTGQKIRIEGSKRNGDWEVVGVSDHKIFLRCPVSHKEITCDRFCYFAEVRDNAPWPMEK